MQINTDIIPIDKYFGLNYFTESKRDDGIFSLLSEMEIDDYDSVYGVSEDEIDEMSPRDKAYRLNHNNPEDIIILFECPHKNDKVRHHPNYKNPYEVELLCRKCHYARHKEQIYHSFGRFSFKKKGVMPMK